MRTLKSALNTLVLASTILCSTVALAGSLSAENVTLREGGVNGGGGDVRCAEYQTMAGRIALAFRQIGQPKVNETLDLINVKQIWEIKQGLKCIPDSQIPRQAVSIPSQKLTKLKGEDWEKFNSFEKMRLTLHELAVLAGYEKDGEYMISEVMLELLQKNSVYFNDLSHAEHTIRNPDETVTFLNPFVLDQNGKPAYISARDFAGETFCKYIGYFTSVKEVGVHTHDKIRIVLFDGRSPRIASFDIGMRGYENGAYLSSIICKPK